MSDGNYQIYTMTAAEEAEAFEAAWYLSGLAEEEFEVQYEEAAKLLAGGAFD